MLRIAVLVIGLFYCASSVMASTPTAPGYGDLPFDIPSAGSYTLPVIDAASDGNVLDIDGNLQSLHSILRGKYTLLNFMYSSCSDVNGCPLSSYVFYRIKSVMQTQPELAKSLQLVSLSFDPLRDTPELMKLYSANFDYAGPAGQWHFLTTGSESDLRPLLETYKQDVQRDLSLSAGPDTQYAHVLRVFLIDPGLNIRNIYSVEYLHADLLLTDVKTLQQHRQESAQANAGIVISQPGDNRDNYESKDYVTNNRSLAARQGQAADLLSNVHQPHIGLPPLPDAVLQGLNAKKVALSRKLFFDRRLSLNDTFSCAMCHVPEQGFSSNELKTPVGFEGRSVRRNAPSLYNVAYAERLFHDAREFRLEDQIWAPLLASNEMANPSIGYVLNKIRNMSDYNGLFEEVYGSEANMANLGDAMSAYQRTLVSGDSAFDRWRYNGDDNALSQDAKNGFAIFDGKAGCSSCHSIGEKSALFTDHQLHNTGIGYLQSMGIKPATERVALAPGVFVEVDREIIDRVSEPAVSDLGFYEVTQNPMDRWKYRTPGLRNVSLSAPYMHDGSLATLREVVEFYNRGGVKNPLLSPLLRPLNLDSGEIDDLVEFLKSLTGSNVNELVSDAFAAPVGDLSSEDPNWANHQRGPLYGEAR